MATMKEIEKAQEAFHAPFKGFPPKWLSFTDVGYDGDVENLILEIGVRNKSGINKAIKHLQDLDLMKVPHHIRITGEIKAL